MKHLGIFICVMGLSIFQAKAHAQYNDPNKIKLVGELRLGIFELEKRGFSEQASLLGFSLGIKKGAQSASIVIHQMNFIIPQLNTRTIGLRLQQDLLRWHRLIFYVFGHAYLASSHSLAHSGLGIEAGAGLDYKINPSLSIFAEMSYGVLFNDIGQTKPSAQFTVGPRWTF